jgi:hypothetical protein
MILDVSRVVVVDVAKTTWTTATRPAPAKTTVRATVVQTGGPAGDPWAQATTGAATETEVEIEVEVETGDGPAAGDPWARATAEITVQAPPEP